MAIRLPIQMPVEYRGIQQGGEFANQQGENIVYGPKLKFEYEDEDGDVQLVPIALAQLDKCEPPFDASKLQKGDEVTLMGFAVMQDRGSARDSFFAITSVSHAPFAVAA